MRGYGDHLQYSIFECQLNATDLVRLRAELAAIIHHDFGPGAFCRSRSFGRARGAGDHGAWKAVYKPRFPLHNRLAAYNGQDASGRAALCARLG